MADNVNPVDITRTILITPPTPFEKWFYALSIQQLRDYFYDMESEILRLELALDRAEYDLKTTAIKNRISMIEQQTAMIHYRAEMLKHPIRIDYMERLPEDRELNVYRTLPTEQVIGIINDLEIEINHMDDLLKNHKSTTAHRKLRLLIQVMDERKTASRFSTDIENIEISTPHTDNVFKPSNMYMHPQLFEKLIHNMSEGEISSFNFEIQAELARLSYMCELKISDQEKMALEELRVNVMMQYQVLVARAQSINMDMGFLSRPTPGPFLVRMFLTMTDEQLASIHMQLQLEIGRIDHEINSDKSTEQSLTNRRMDTNLHIESLCTAYKNRHGELVSLTEGLGKAPLPTTQPISVASAEAERAEVLAEPVQAAASPPEEAKQSEPQVQEPAVAHSPPRNGQSPTADSPVTLGIDVDTQQPVTLEGESKDLGLYMIGAPGVGKSTLMLNMILQDISQGNGVCVLDPHGDLINDILARANADPNRIILLDPTDYTHPFGLNLFECPDVRNPTMRARTISYVMGIFEKLWGDDGLHPSWGAQLEDILRHVTQAFVSAKIYTLIDVPLFLEDEHFRARVIEDLTPQIQDYWERSYNPRKDQITYRSSTLNKVRKFTDDEILYPILGTSHSTINFYNEMDEQKIILATLPVGKIGDEAVSLLGSLLVGQLLQATLARVEQPTANRTPMSLYCDEYYYFATTDFPRFFAEGRKFRVSTIIAHQGRYQLDNISKQATLNVANRVVFRVSAKDAQELSREFTYTPPKQTQFVVQRPLDVILRRQHANPTVNAFAGSIGHMIDSLQNTTVATGITRALHIKSVLDALTDHTNKFLHDVMSNPMMLRSYTSRQCVFEILQLASWSHYQGDWNAYMLMIGISELFASYDDVIKIDTSKMPKGQSDINTYILAKQRQEIATIANAYTVLSDDDFELESRWRALKRAMQQPKPNNWLERVGTPTVNIDFGRYKQWCDQFIKAVRIFMETPIYDTNVIDAPEADAKTADIVTLISNLDRYYARTRLQHGDSIYEGTIGTLQRFSWALSPSKSSRKVGRGLVPRRPVAAWINLPKNRPKAPSCQISYSCPELQAGNHPG